MSELNNKISISPEERVIRLKWEQESLTADSVPGDVNSRLKKLLEKGRADRVLRPHDRSAYQKVVRETLETVHGIEFIQNGEFVDAISMDSMQVGNIFFIIDYSSPSVSDKYTPLHQGHIMRCEVVEKSETEKGKGYVKIHVKQYQEDIFLTEKENILTQDILINEPIRYYHDTLNWKCRLAYVKELFRLSRQGNEQ